MQMAINYYKGLLECVREALAKTTVDYTSLIALSLQS